MSQLTVQIAAIGAMQRSHPALTDLFLQWVEIPELHLASFMFQKQNVQQHIKNPMTLVRFKPSRFAQVETINPFADVLGLPANAGCRNMHEIVLSAKHPAHANFWNHLHERHRTVADSPIEWWWHLLVMRTRSVEKASTALLRNLGLDTFVPRKSVIRWENPTLHLTGRSAEELLTGPYARPTHMVVNAGRAVSIATTDSMCDMLISLAYGKAGEN